MCKFGVAALESFRERLPEWPQYCQHLYAIPHFAQVLPDIVPLLEAVPGARASPSEAPGVSVAPRAPLATGSASASPGSAPPGLLAVGLHGGGDVAAEAGC